MQLEFLLPAQCNGHRQNQQAPCALVETRTRPDLAPDIAGNEVLELAVESVTACQRTVDIGLAQHAASCTKAKIVTVRFIHGSLMRRGSRGQPRGRQSPPRYWRDARQRG